MSDATPSGGAADDAEAVARAAVSHWEAVASATAPILGHRGVAALYRRALHIASREHACLAGAFETCVPLTFENLRGALAQQPAEAASAASAASLKALKDLLTHLIGGALADKLLARATDPLQANQDNQHE